jgi:hypothetical protein
MMAPLVADRFSIPRAFMLTDAGNLQMTSAVTSKGLTPKDKFCLIRECYGGNFARKTTFVLKHLLIITVESERPTLTTVGDSRL